MEKKFVSNGLDTKGLYTYYAFISYQRKDEKWAKWLQRKLENYKLPVANAKDAADKKSKYIRPVFRDKTDLTAGPLPDALKEALQQSRYLIVICSPNAVKSPWVNEEIETFTLAGRTEFVIPFIVDGEPYSKDSAKECFPDAIKAIPKDKEPLGVNINENGKERAFIRTVAYMLNVKFDELWNRFERHRRKIRNITIACCAFLALLAFGVYDYTRTKVEYYADWVDCNGVAQGVIPLNDEQVSHRHASYKFEYSRVPFGEKGFYSWRLNRVSLINSKGVISTSVPDNHAFFYPIQEYKYTDGYVTEIINRDTYNRVVMRYTIKDDYDHKAACLVDIEGKEKHQGSAYLSGSTTAFLSDANPNMSKIKRFHYTRNEKGYITKVTYHANDADELEESAIGDNNNIYGKLFDLDDFGRVTKVTYINHEGSPMTDKYGVGYIRCNNASFEGNDTTEYLGSDGELAYNEHRFARQINKLDKYGNPIESYNEGADGKPCYDYKNIYRQVVSFDENGCFREIKYYGFDGNLSYCSDNYAIQRVKYDTKGRYIEVSHYDVNDKPCYIKGNYSISRVKYNSNDCIIEQSVYDINDRPCIETIMGSHIICTAYDTYNYLTNVEIYNEQKELSLSSVCHFAKQISSYDDYHQLISIKNFDEKGIPCYYTDNTSEHKYQYDNRGNMVKTECLDTDGKPCVCKDGYATLLLKYDNYGNLVEERFLGVDNMPTYVSMYSIRRYDYFPNGLLKEERYYGANDSLCLNSSWFAIRKNEYDTNGHMTKVCYFNTDTIPCYGKEWQYSTLEEKYKDGDVIEDRFYDKHGNLSNNNRNYAIARCIYDNKHRAVSIRYFDNNDKPCNNSSFVHCDSIEYDEKGQKVREVFYDKNNQMCNVKNGASQTEYYYNEKGIVSEISYAYTSNSTIRNKTYYCIYEYDNLGRITKEQYLGKDREPVWNNVDISIKEYAYDRYGNLEQEIYRAPDGSLSPRGWSIRKMKYDNLSRIIETRFFGKDQQPIGGKNNFPIEKYRYEENFEQASMYYNDSLLFSHINYYYEKGLVKRMTFTNKENKLQIKYMLGVTDIPCAMISYEYNEKGQIVKSSYYNESNLLYNTNAGMAYITNEYNEKGLQVSAHYYDVEGKLANASASGAAYVIYNYDIYGNMTEQSFYDKNKKLANTPWSWSRRLQTFNDRGISLTDTYYMPDGEIESFKRKEDGTFISTNLEKEENIPEKERTILLLQVETYGQMFEAGFRGSYIILEWNEWNTYNTDAEALFEAFSASRGKEKHLVLLPFTEKGYGDIIEHTFTAEALSARIMDSISETDENHKEVIKRYEEWKKTKQ